MSGDTRAIELLRGCPATTVPFGEQVELCAGGEVQIVQRLGGSITVRTPMGMLLRIDGTDVDALGLDPPDVPPTGAQETFEFTRVTDALDTVYDPELPLSIVELGLVYRCEALEQPDGTYRVEIDITMTAPGCGMGEVLRRDAEDAVEAVPGVDDVVVTLVRQPPWTIERMSDAAKLQLGLL